MRGSTLTEQPARATANERSIVGRTLGEFVVEAAVDGAAGVYRALQRSLAREAIVKAVDVGNPPADAPVSRFLLETRLAARLDHPYAAHIYAFGAEPDGLLWIAMELVRGTPLDVLLAEKGPLQLERLLPFLQRLAEVVDAAHEASIVHRDIKPSNVMAMARAGTLFPKLLDFGVAAALDDVRPSATRVGSPHYMAPEQWQAGARPLPQSDLYSLAVLTFEALSGRVPFDGATLDAIAAAHREAPRPTLGGDEPGPLDEVLQRALAVSPAARFPTAQAFADALRRVMLGGKRALPRLPGALRDAYLVHAPRPLAEAVADLEAAADAGAALAATWQLVGAALRLVGLLALAARLAHGGRGDDAAGDELLRGLGRGGLTDEEWLALARALVAPRALPRDVYPIPELIDVLDGSGPFDALLALRRVGGAAADELLGLAAPQVARLLESLRVLEHYHLVVGRDDGADEWMGVRRARRGPPLALSRGPAPGRVALATDDGALLLELDPLFQARRPLPSADEELFLLDGADGPAARLCAAHAGFVISDERGWAALEERLGVGARAGQPQAPLAVEQSPYLGLASFSTADASIFVGRERDVEMFLNRIRVQPFVGVVGPSGAGKSSFVSAGVIPALAPSWRAVVVRPGAAPMEALTLRLLREGLCDEARRAALAADPEALAAELRRRAEAGPILVVVDQLEELFTLCADAAEHARFADTLARIARSVDEPLRVVITVRDDFLVRVETLPALRDRLSQGFHLLSTPAREELLRILIEPARHAGYEFDDPELPAEMVAEVADQPGALALLSFTALRLWELRDRGARRLTRRSYEEMGGVGGALASHADAMLALMTPEEWGLVRQAFRRLVTAEGTRAVAERAEVVQVLGGGATAERVLERLILSRLLVASDRDGSGEQLEIIHEALLTAWPRLVEWRREDEGGARLLDQLRVAAQQWERRGRPRGLLWRDDVLAELRAWRNRFPEPLADVERAFADASVAAARRSVRARRIAIGGAMAALAVVLVVVAASERRAARSADRAETQVALLHREKGREALFSGDPLRALAHLGEALRRGLDGPMLRYPLALATRQLSSHLVAVEHGARIWDVAFTPRGDLLATAGDDRTTRVWDTATGALRFTLGGHGDVVRAIDFSPDGARLVTGAVDGSVRLWDAASGTLVRALDGHPDAIRVARFSPDGARIVLASADGTVSIAATSGAGPPITFRAHEQRLWTAELSPDGRLLATASSDHTVRLWDATSGAPLRTLEGHTDRVIDATFSPDGRTLASAGYDRALRLWDVERGTLVRVLPPTSQVISHLVFFPDGRRLALAGVDKVVQIVDLADGATTATLIGHTGYLNGLAVSPDGSLVATGGSDGTARLWDGMTGQPLATLYGHVEAVWSVRFDASGRRLVTGGHDGVARVWDPRRPGEIFFRGHGDAVQWAGFSADGTRVLSTASDRTARAWDAASGEQLTAREFRADDRQYLVASWDPDGKRVLVCDGEDARIVEVATGDVRVLHGHRGVVRYATFNHDATLAITAADDGAKLWDTATGKLLGTYPWQAVWVGAAAISPHDRRIATVVGDKDIAILDAATGAQKLLLRGGKLGYQTLQFSPDGRRLLAASQDKSAKIWDLERGALLWSLEGHQAEVMSARYSRDGARVVTAGADGLANVWDASTGELLLSFAAPQPLNWAELSPDGTRLVVAGEDHTVRLWNVAPDARSPAEVERSVRCHSPFHVAGAQLLREAVDRSACQPR